MIKSYSGKLSQSSAAIKEWCTGKNKPRTLFFFRRSSFPFFCCPTITNFFYHPQQPPPQKNFRRLSPTRPTPYGVDRIFEQHNTTTLLFCSHSVYGWVSCSLYHSTTSLHSSVFTVGWVVVVLLPLLLSTHSYLRLGELWLFYFHYFFSFIRFYGWVSCGCLTSTTSSHSFASTVGWVVFRLLR